MGTMGSAVAQIEGADEYHNTLSSDLQENHELPQGEFVYGLTEQDAIDAFRSAGRAVGRYRRSRSTTQTSRSRRASASTSTRNRETTGITPTRDTSPTGRSAPVTSSWGSRTPEATPTAPRPRRASSIGIRALTAKRPSAARSSRTGRRSSRTESGRGTTSRSRSVRTLTARSSNRISSSGPASRNRVSSSAASR